MVRICLARVCLLLLLTLALALNCLAKAGKRHSSRRQKREWIIPPAKLKENHDYTLRPFIAKIRSDKEEIEKLEYSLTGPGADKPPFNLFIVNHEDGCVRITGILDREKQAEYNLLGVAMYKNGTLAEDNIPLTISVIDENDNAPYFELTSGEIPEGSTEGTFVLKVNAKDDDKEGYLNSQIAYEILSQEPKSSTPMFQIDADTGNLYVNKDTLDRETEDFYELVVKGTDMGGAEGGLTGTGTVEIKILDINDNVPTLEKSDYTGSVNENEVDVVVMRIKALDEDLEYTDNWEAVFHIVKGNEDGLFAIETDTKTNEGILKLVKAVDYEDLQKLELGLVIENVAPFAVGSAVEMDVDVAPKTKPKIFSIKIAVNNIPEGPSFSPTTKLVPISEDPADFVEDEVITTYAALDGDTGQPAEDVSYAKAYDPDNWFTIDEKTAEIKLNKKPNRESEFLVNGTYYAKILCMTQDMPAKTATGTIAIQVLDTNNHCPTLTTSYESVCSDERTVYVTACDKDFKPNAAPFNFTVVTEGTRGKWEIKPFNETTAVLHSHEALWPGVYDVVVEVADEQGFACPEKEVFKVEVCTCSEGGECLSRLMGYNQTHSSKLSASAIGLILASALLLLLLPLLLLFCHCGDPASFADQFTELPFDAKEYLISYHTEGNGEDREVPLLSVPVVVTDQANAGTLEARNMATKSSRVTSSHRTSGMYSEYSHTLRQEANVSHLEMDTGYGIHREAYNPGMSHSSTYGRYTHASRARLDEDMFEGIALPDAFLQDYYLQKVACAVRNLPEDDQLVYDYEGQGSPVGSVGCCSLLEADNDLQFLNDLGPKFRTLAEVCSPPQPPQPKSPTVERVVESKQTIQKESNVTKSTVNINQSSTSMANIHQSSTSNVNINQSSVTSHVTQAPLSPPAGQTILVQQPMYYTTRMLQPVHYVMEPQVHNTVLLAERPATNLQGVMVVNGSQGSSTGLVIQGNRVVSETTSGITTTSPGSPIGPTASTSPVMMAPGSHGWVQGSVPTGGWATVGHTPDGKYMVIERQVKSQALGPSPGVPQGTLPRDAVQVQVAVPPQGALGTAGQGSVHGLLPGHTLTRGVGQVGMGLVRVVPVGVGQPRVGQVIFGQPGMGQIRGMQLGDGQVLAGQTMVRQVLPAGVVLAGVSQVSVGQMAAGFQGVPVCAQQGLLLRGGMTGHEGPEVTSPRHTTPPEFSTTQTNTVAESRFTYKTAAPADNKWESSLLSREDSDEEDDEPGQTSEDVSESEDAESETTAPSVPDDPTLEDSTKGEDALEAFPPTTEDMLDEGPTEEPLVLTTEASVWQSEQPGSPEEEPAEDPANLDMADESISPMEASEDLQTAEETGLEIRSSAEEIMEEAESQETKAQEEVDLSDEGSVEDASMLAQGSIYECSLSGSDIIDLVAEDQLVEEESRILEQGEEVMSGLSQDEPTVDNVEENLKEERPEEMGSEIHLDHLTMGVPIIPTVTSDPEEVLPEVEEVRSDADSDHLSVDHSLGNHEETHSEMELSQSDLHEKPSAVNITEGQIEEGYAEIDAILHQIESGNSIEDDQEVEKCINEEVTSSLKHQTTEDSIGDDQEEEGYIEEEYTKEEVMSSLHHQTSGNSTGDDQEEEGHIEEEYTKEEVMSSLHHQTSGNSTGDDQEKEGYIEEEYTKEEVMSSLHHQTSGNSTGDDQEKEGYIEEEYTKEEVMSSLQNQTPGEYTERPSAREAEKEVGSDQDVEILPSVESEGLLEEEAQIITQDVNISEETEEPDTEAPTQAVSYSDGEPTGGDITQYGDIEDSGVGAGLEYEGTTETESMETREKSVDPEGELTSEQDASEETVKVEDEDHSQVRDLSDQTPEEERPIAEDPNEELTDGENVEAGEESEELVVDAVDTEVHSEQPMGLLKVDSATLENTGPVEQEGRESPSDVADTGISTLAHVALASPSLEETSEGGESKNDLVVGEVSGAEVTSAAEAETDSPSSMPETEIMAAAQTPQTVDLTSGPTEEEFAVGLELPEGAVSVTEGAADPTDTRAGLETAGATGGSAGDVIAHVVQAPRNSKRKSKKGSTKSPTSPTRRCRQQ